MPVSHNGIYHHNIHRLLDLNYDTPLTLSDIGITSAAAKHVQLVLVSIWEHADMPFCSQITATMRPSGDVLPAAPQLLRPCIEAPVPGQFTEDQLNCVWAAF
eukprot:2969118-Rhodomonas_salina.1